MLEEIKVFVAVARQGSFTKAAESMNLSRSVISKKLTELERSLNVRLLNRTTRRLSLTEAGERLFERAQQSLAHIDEAIAEVSSFNQEPKGRLYVNLPMSFGLIHIAPLISEFRTRYPLINIELNFEDRKVDVINPGYDVSIRIANLQDSTLTARRLCTCRHLIVAAPSYLEAIGAPTHPKDLSNGHIIASFRYQDSALEWQFKSKTGEQNIKLASTIVANNSLALKEIVMGGAAIARMPTFLMAPEIANGKLMALLPEYECPTREIYVVYPKREYLAIKTRAFIDFIAEKIPDPPYWD